MEEAFMTVKELRDALSNLDGNAHVVISWEDGDNHHLIGIESVSLQKGTPKRLPNGKPGFTFESNGPAAWVFISAAEE
jgi:hypothetical protein